MDLPNLPGIFYQSLLYIFRGYVIRCIQIYNCFLSPSEKFYHIYIYPVYTLVILCYLKSVLLGWDKMLTTRGLELLNFLNKNTKWRLDMTMLLSLNAPSDIYSDEKLDIIIRINISTSFYIKCSCMVLIYTEFSRKATT